LPLEPITHVVVFQKLTPVSLSDAFTDGGAKANGLVHKAQGRGFHQMLRVRSRMGGKPGKLRFLFWRKMNFHSFSLGSGKLDVNGISLSQDPQSAKVQTGQSELACVPL
jgi:hypothetical protein